MACMDKETFEIYHNECIVPQYDYIELDDLIAPAIQTLNRKKYITEFCCSGHQFNDSLSIVGFEKSGYRYYKMDCRQPPNAYISFIEGVSLPTLPNGFIIDALYGPSDKRLVIRKQYYDLDKWDFNAGKDFFEVTRDIVETMRQLYEWAVGLPEFKG